MVADESLLRHRGYSGKSDMGGEDTSATYVRRGDWKLIRFYCDNHDQSDRHELYNLREDLGETKDLSAAMPDKVKELATLIDGFLKDSGAVVPKPNLAYDPQAKAPAPAAGKKKGVARKTGARKKASPRPKA